MSEKKVRAAEQFKSWHKERMGHPLGIQLARRAINELELENQQLAQDKAELVEALLDLLSHSETIEAEREDEAKRSFARTITQLYCDGAMPIVMVNASELLEKHKCN